MKTEAIGSILDQNNIETYLWKIVLYYYSYERGSSQLPDPSLTRRVLNGMHVHEW